MVLRPRLAATFVFATLAGCRAPNTPAAIDPALAARVPASTGVLAGVDLDRLRGSPLHAKLPPAARAFLTPFAAAHRVLIAATGGELLVIARGTVAGATQLAPDLALYGAPSLIAAATAAHPAAAILSPAATVGANPLWMAIRGGVALPLEGNLANLNNLLRDTESVTITLQPTDPAKLELLARCPSAAAATHFEQSLRAVVSLAAASNAREPAIAAALESTAIDRDQSVVRVALSARLDTFAQWLAP